MFFVVEIISKYSRFFKVKILIFLVNFFGVSTGWAKKFQLENWEVARIFLTSESCYLHNSEKQDKFW